MAGPTHGALRLLRAAAVAVVVVSVAAAAHVGGGGHAPTPRALILAGLLTTSAFTVASGRRLTTVRIAAMLAAGQVVLHQLFMVGASPMHGHAFPQPAMLAAHAVATVLATIVLLHGERALWTVWTWLNWAVRWPAVAVLGAPPAPPRPSGFVVPWPLRTPRRGEPQRRGPPRVLLTLR